MLEVHARCINDVHNNNKMFYNTHTTWIPHDESIIMFKGEKLGLPYFMQPVYQKKKKLDLRDKITPGIILRS